MVRLLVAVTDSVFPDLDPEREVPSMMGADLLFAKEPKPEAILEVANGAGAVLTTYAKVTADLITRMMRCRITSRFGIGVDCGSAGSVEDRANRPTQKNLVRLATRNGRRGATQDRVTVDETGAGSKTSAASYQRSSPCRWSQGGLRNRW